MVRAHADDTPPANLNVDNGAPITTAVSVTVASNRPLYAWWFWVPTTNTGTYTLEMWDITGDDDPGPAAGTLLTSKAVAAEAVTPGQWNRVDFDAPINAVTTKVYRAARHASSGRYVSTALAFSGAEISNGGITLIESGTNPGALFPGVLRNGTFREGAAGNYPASSFNATDYYLDVDDESSSPDPIDVAGAVTVGNLVVAGTATVGYRAAGAVVIGELAVSGEALVKTPVSVAGGIVIGEVVARVTMTHPVTERPPGFEPLAAMFRDAKRNMGATVPTPDCPYDGSTLEGGRGRRHCPFCGRTYS